MPQLIPFVFFFQGYALSGLLSGEQAGAIRPDSGNHPKDACISQERRGWCENGLGARK
jgi:hypothetical protein